jgi:hypothetical protein
MKYLLALFIFFPTSALATQNITINANKFCADAIGIPYASDNFTDFEWEQFQQCIKILNEYEVY